METNHPHYEDSEAGIDDEIARRQDEALGAAPEGETIYTLVSVDFDEIREPVPFASFRTFQAAVEHLAKTLIEDNHLDEDELAELEQEQYSQRDAWNDIVVDYEGEEAAVRGSAADDFGWTIVVRKSRLL